MKNKNLPPFKSKFFEFTKLEYQTSDEVKEVISELERVRINFEKVLTRK